MLTKKQIQAEEKRLGALQEWLHTQEAKEFGKIGDLWAEIIGYKVALNYVLFPTRIGLAAYLKREIMKRGVK